MARKVYRTKNGITSYGIGLVIPGRKDKVYVYFTGGITHPKFIPSTFETESLEEQTALEKHANFGKKFELVPTPKTKNALVKEEKTGEDEEPLKVFQNTTVQSAVSTLTKQGWEGNPDELVTIEDVQQAAKSIGISFPKLK